MTRESIKEENKSNAQSIPYGEWGIFQEDVEYIIDKIYDDFESRTCENCKHYINKPIISYCNNDNSMAYNLEENLVRSDGCNKWETT
jgi:hypothetical protein